MTGSVVISSGSTLKVIVAAPRRGNRAARTAAARREIVVFDRTSLWRGGRRRWRACRRGAAHDHLERAAAGNHDAARHGGPLPPTAPVKFEEPLHHAAGTAAVIGIAL